MFIEFSQMHLGHQVSDLYRFMRKVMEKHGWDEYLGCAMLDAYDAMLPMSRNDRSCLYFLFLYPEKYWKQLNYYYNANKAWIPEKNVEKLKTLESQKGGKKAISVENKIDAAGRFIFLFFSSLRYNKISFKYEGAQEERIFYERLHEDLPGMAVQSIFR